MNDIIPLVLVVLLSLWSATVPKTRSYLPSTVTLTAIAALLFVAFDQWQKLLIIPEKYLLWVMMAIMAIPVITSLCVLRQEKLSTVLGKLNAENKCFIENIIAILQKIYLNGKAMAEELSTTIDRDKVAIVNTEVYKALGLRSLTYIDSHEGSFSLMGKIKILLYLIWDVFVLMLHVLFPLFPRSIKEIVLLQVTAVLDVVGVGMDRIENTSSDLNHDLREQLWSATRGVRSDKSVNAIQKCLKYAHAINNAYMFELINTKTGSLTLSGKLGRYVAVTRGNNDHVMAQRFAEVADAISKELGG